MDTTTINVVGPTLLHPHWQWCVKGCNNSQQCWDLQCTMGRVQLIRLWRPWLWARSIQPKFRLVRSKKEDHLKSWTRFFETFPVGPNRSIEFWTEISGKFGWMDHALCNACAWPQQCWESCANRSSIVALRFRDHRTKMLGVVCSKVWPVSNFEQQHPTTCNRVCKWMQHVTFNVQCWGL